MAAHQGPEPVRRGAVAAALRAAASSARAAAAAARAVGLIDVSATAVAAAQALAAAAALALPADPETEMRMEAIQPFVQEEVAAGAAGRAPRHCGRARAARNVAVHWRPGAGLGSLRSALQRPQAAQRGQRKADLPIEMEGSTKYEVTSTDDYAVSDGGGEVSKAESSLATDLGQDSGHLQSDFQKLAADVNMQLEQMRGAIGDLMRGGDGRIGNIQLEQRFQQLEQQHMLPQQCVPHQQL